MQRPRIHRTISRRRAWPLAAAAGTLAFCGVAGDSRAQSTCTEASCPADFIALHSPQIQTTTTSFKFQARISQAKLPVDEVEFPTVIVKLRGDTQTWCTQTLNKVQVRDSVLNLEVGPETGMTCSMPIEEVIASKSGLGFQICINDEENCLKPISLSSVPYSVKAEFARRAQQAHEADIAAQCHYAHRVAADLDLLTNPTIGTGYFDFHSALVDSTIQGVPIAKQDGLMQWAPVAGSEVLNVCLKTNAGGIDPGLDRLSELRLHAVETSARGRLRVYESTRLDAQLDVMGPTYRANRLEVGGYGLFQDEMTVDGNVALGSSLDVGGPVGMGSTLRVTGATTLQNGLSVTGPTTLQGNMLVQGAGTTTVFQGPVTFEKEVSIALPMGAMTADTLDVIGWANLGQTGTGTLWVTGAANLMGSTTTGTLTVTGATTVNSLSVSSTANFTGGAQVIEGGLTMGTVGNTVFGRSQTVATTAYSVSISGGETNRAHGNYGVVGGGFSNVVGLAGSPPRFGDPLHSRRRKWEHCF